jgi:hypothetical protein
MKFRSFVLLLLIIIAIGGAFVFGFLMLSSMQKENDQEEIDPNPNSYPTSFPTSTPTSYPTQFEEVVNIQDNQYKYAFVDNENNIGLINIEDEIIYVNLEQNNWKDLKWSTDGKLLAVLGETEEDTWNIFIYNPSIEEWKQATNYRASQTGVSTYLWTNGNTLLFIQGQEGERWVHRFEYIAKEEIIKVFKTNGELYRSKSDNSRIIIKTPNDFEFRTVEGDLVYSASQHKDGSNEISNITKLTVTEDPNVFLITTEPAESRSDNYLAYYGAKSAPRIFIARNFYPICALSQDAFLGYRLNIDTLDFLKLIPKSNDIEIVSSLPKTAEIDFSKTNCDFEQGVSLVRIAEGDEEKWIEITLDNQVNELTNLSDIKELKIK